MKRFEILRQWALKAAVVGLALGAAAPAPVAAQAETGAYLAARQAIFDRSFAAQAQYAARALTSDPSNVELLETLVSAQISMGQFAEAFETATSLKALEPNSQVAAMILLPRTVQNSEWEQVIDLIESGQAISPLVDELVKAWSYVGAGNMTAALEQFDAAASVAAGFEAYSKYNRALALALVGDFEGGLALLEDRAMMVSQNAVFARVQMLSQLERNEDALALLNDLFGASPAPYIRTLSASLERGETLDFDVVTSVQDGVAGVFQSVAEIVDGELDIGYTLLYARIALELRPERAEYALIVADLLERLEQYDLATQTLEAVSAQSPSYYLSELARARGLQAVEQFDAQIEVLEDLAKTYPDLPDVLSALGDAYRRQENYQAAAEIYTKALATLPAGARGQWPLLFARGTTFERDNQWEKAEADFRAALDINPNQPQVLNYMGYAFIEMNTNLEEAMEMIRTAVEARPDDGYITDSLAWGLFQLARYEEAVAPMEKAAQLMPVDPIINDHLGDVYWAVGRAREAEFQWERALSFEPEEDEAERIRRKLLLGLDQVLIDEGKPATRAAQND